MKILHVIPAFYPARGYGGGPLVAYEMAKRLVRLGHQVTVWTTDAADSSTRYTSTIEHRDGFEVRRFRNVSNVLAARRKMFLSPGILISAALSVREFDLVHLHDTRTFQNVAVGFASLLGGVPYLMQPHGTLSSKSVRASTLKTIFDVIAGGILIRRASRLLVLNETEAACACRTGLNRNRIAILPNGIDLSLYTNHTDRGVFRRLFGIKEDVPIVLYVGRIHESKGLDLLVRAFRRLRDRGKNVKLVFVGPDDGYMRKLGDCLRDAGIEEDALILGEVDEHVKQSAFIDAQVFATPTFYGFPLTFLEAMAYGVPIATTDSGDVLQSMNGRTGFITRADDEEFAGVLELLLDDTEKRQLLSETARRMVSEYDWDIIVRKLENIYTSVVGET